MALEQVETDFVFLSDIDFLPGTEAYQDLRNAISVQYDQLDEDKGEKLALVVPAFETLRYRLNSFPKTKAEVLNLLDLGTLLTFRYLSLLILFM